MDTANLPVLVYQPGKVGSKTIERTLCRNGIPSIAMHALTWKEIHCTENLHPELKELNHMRRVVRRTIDVTPDNVRWKIVTLVREPVARTCSNVFQNKDRFLPHLIDQPDEQIFTGIMDCVHSRLKALGTETCYIDSWFDREMKEVFECDVFSIPFDRSQGFQIYRAPHADILLFKLENLSDCFQQAFSLFLGRPITQLHNSNVTNDLSHSQMYNRAKRALKVPLCDLQHIYSKRYVTHFYTPDQIEGFIRKWAVERELANFASDNIVSQLHLCND